MYTQNNSNEMKTVVETFVIEETAELIYDDVQLGQWNSIVEELGLKGQTKIVKPTKSPIPFMHMKQTLVNVFETLCPRKVNVQDYDITPIPVEILQLLALSNREGYFSKTEIWYDDKNPDPVAVGITSEFKLYHYDGVPKEAESRRYPSKKDALAEIRKFDPNFKETKSFGWEENMQHYLIGKWADVKHSFDELKEMAAKRYIKSNEVDLKKRIKDAQRQLDDLEIEAFERFN